MKNTKTAIFDTAKSIPYIGSYLNLASKVKSIPDAIFMDKMEGFAAGIGDLTEKQIRTFSEKADETLMKNLVYLVDSAKMEWQPHVFGSIFRRFINDEISICDVNRVYPVICSMSEEDLENCINTLKAMNEDPNDQKGLCDHEYVKQLLHYGLFVPDHSELSAFAEVGMDGDVQTPMVRYKPSELGTVFLTATKQLY